MADKKQQKFGLVYLTGALLVIAYALGFTVSPNVWNTRNVLRQAMPIFIGCGALALVCIVLYRILAVRGVHRIVKLLLMVIAGACAMFALTAMWYDCVVEIAYIYGEGNLEMGNQAAVNGSIMAFVASGAYVLAAIGTVCLSAKE